MFSRVCIAALLWILAASALATACALVVEPPAAPPKLLRDYEFKNDLKDTTGLGPVLKDFNGKVADGAYVFEAGQGLRLELPGIADQYAIEVTFKFEDVDGWQKVIDFKNRSVDAGVYVYNGQLQFYSDAIGGTIEAGKLYTVRIERNNVNQAVAGYVNDVKAWEFTDTQREAVFDNSAWFFMDDRDGVEVSAGSVTRLRILDRPAVVPAPPVRPAAPAPPAIPAKPELRIPRPARPPKLVRDFRFDNSLADALGSKAVLTPSGGMLGAGQFRFEANQGLRLDRPGVGDHYTIEMTFQLHAMDGYKKLIDFKNRETDVGLYAYNGRLHFYSSLGDGGDVPAGRDVTLRLDRDAPSSTVTAFIDGQPVWQFRDFLEDAVLGDGPFYFFQDDLRTTNEASAGVVTRLRMWDSPGGM